MVNGKTEATMPSASSRRARNTRLLVDVVHANVSMTSSKIDVRMKISAGDVARAVLRLAHRGVAHAAPRACPSQRTASELPSAPEVRLSEVRPSKEHLAGAHARGALSRSPLDTAELRVKTRLNMLGFIFDCDGVLVDSEALSCGAWLPVLRRRGIAVEFDDILPFIGKSDQALREHFSRQSGLVLESDAADEWQAQYFASALGRLASFPGLVELLEVLERRHAKLAVASSGPPAKICFNLEQAGLASRFGVVVSRVEVAQGKPAPDLFLLAAERLGLSPTDCAVVEDSVYGIQAARRAGMLALGFASSHSAAVLHEAGAHAVFDDYAALVAWVSRDG